jgi:hypothetical protein
MAETRDLTHRVLMTALQGRTLYHFTSNGAAKKIAAKGLKSNWVLDMPREALGMMRGVWLTDDPQLPPKYSRSAERRIELVIPRTDPKLLHLRSLLVNRRSTGTPYRHPKGALTHF